MSLANPRRTSLTISVKQSTLEAAAALGIDAQAVCEKALSDGVTRQWKDEHKAAIDECNRWVEANGLPVEKYRLF